MHRLLNTIRHYPWGSTSHIQALLGIIDDQRPYAEMWLGAYPAAPSMVAPGASAEPMRLDAVVATDPVAALGRAAAERFGDQFPYLLKLLAAGQPLSLQVHPHGRRAAQQHEAENALGIPPDAPERNYRDSNHKPEMLLAMTPMHVLAGFRDPMDSARTFESFGLDELQPILDVLRGDLSSSEKLHRAFTALLDCPDDAAAELVPRVATAIEALDGKAVSEEEANIHRTGLALAEYFSTDIGVVAALMLNTVMLQPGEALFVDAGVMHCYVDGFGIEIMASSDNVLRAGLTGKHIDRAELLQVVDFAPAPAAMVSWATVQLTPEVSVSIFDRVADEFELNILSLDHAAVTPFARCHGPRIALSLDGAVEVTVSDHAELLHAGESVFVPDSDGVISVAGTGRLAIATTQLGASRATAAPMP